MRGAKRDVEEQLEAARGTVGGTAEGERLREREGQRTTLTPSRHSHLALLPFR